MATILGTDGKPLQQKQDDNTEAADSTTQEPVQPKIPLPEEGDAVLSAIVDTIDDSGGQKRVNIKFHVHAAISPLEALSILENFAAMLYHSAQQQLNSTIQTVPANTLDELAKKVKP